MMILGMALAAAAPVATKPTTLQAQFDAAADAYAERRCAEAVTAYLALERHPAILRNPLARAAAGVRKGVCLIRTGHVAEGEAAIRANLPTVEAKGADFAGDVRDARTALAGAAQLRFDYDVAIAETEKALALATGADRITPLQMLAGLTMFDGDGRALRYAEEARTLVAGAKAFAKTDVAAVQTTSARVLLNAGRAKEGYALLKDSLAKQGGLTTRIRLGDVSTRSDLAIAALLTGDKDGARQYLAFTGAGRISDAPFARAQAMDPPACDPTIGLKPSDVAVVEFSLGEDGQVLSALPVYVTGGRQAAIAFARAVAGWSWSAEQAKQVPPFYRALTRVELRCSTGADVPDSWGLLADAASAWLFADDAPAWDGLSDAAAVSRQRAALAAARPGTRAELAALFALTRNVSLPTPERQTLVDRAAALAPGVDAPAPLRTWLGVTRLQSDEVRGDRWRESLRALLADPAIGGDPLSASVLRLALAGRNARRKGSPEDLALLDRVIAEPGLPEHHPLKVHALLRKANLLAEGGDLAGADAAFRKTGLDAEQCAMLGVTPALKHSGANSSDFPMEAMRWGFEGWVQTEFDIAADGRTVQQRAIIAYPPFVFDEAAIGIARQSRWTSSYRPGGSVACAASHMPIRFMLPGR